MRTYPIPCGICVHRIPDSYLGDPNLAQIVTSGGATALTLLLDYISAHLLAASIQHPQEAFDLQHR